MAVRWQTKTSLALHVGLFLELEPLRLHRMGPTIDGTRPTPLISPRSQTIAGPTRWAFHASSTRSPVNDFRSLTRC